jgi:hypothetical protein
MRIIVSGHSPVAVDLAVPNWLQHAIIIVLISAAAAAIFYVPKLLH